jgi:integrase
MVRHSHQDALDDRTFEQLLDAAATLDEPFDAEASFILIAGGRLGMRAGEISHCKAHWVNWDRELIEIPAQEDCTDGEDGTVCGYCKNQARQQLEYDPSLSLEDAISERWQPKTSNSARAIPFGFDDEVRAVVEAFFDEHDGYPRSRVSINRRVDKVAERAGIDKERVYPHALRATAATHHAYRGLRTAPLQALMGWERIETAQKYVRLSGGATAEALEEVHAES